MGFIETKGNEVIKHLVRIKQNRSFFIINLPLALWIGDALLDKDTFKESPKSVTVLSGLGLLGTAALPVKKIRIYNLNIN